MKIKNYRQLNDKLHASGLPTPSNVLYLYETYGIDTVIDLTERPREKIASKCEKLGIAYFKIGIDEQNPLIEQFEQAITIYKQSSKCLVFCFKGLHRTGAFLYFAGYPFDSTAFRSHPVLMNLMQSNKQIYLYQVGRNLNRCVRTVDFFGINQLFTIQCTGEIKGNLFAAKDKVVVTDTPNLPQTTDCIYFETDGDVDIKDVDTRMYRKFVFGGETTSLPKTKNVLRCKIPNIGNISGLTVEAALSIVLYHNNQVCAALFPKQLK